MRVDLGFAEAPRFLTAASPLTAGISTHLRSPTPAGAPLILAPRMPQVATSSATMINPPPSYRPPTRQPQVWCTTPTNTHTPCSPPRPLWSTLRRLNRQQLVCWISPLCGKTTHVGETWQASLSSCTVLGFYWTFLANFMKAFTIKWTCIIKPYIIMKRIFIQSWIPDKFFFLCTEIVDLSISYFYLFFLLYIHIFILVDNLLRIM